MSIEDFLLRFEGLSDEQIKAAHGALIDAQHTMMAAQMLITAIETELPRIKKIVATLGDVLATVNAKQKEFGS